MDERPAPVVTITDPRRPLAEGDLLASGDERVPWRAKRWHYEALGLVVALGLAVIIPQHVVSARAADHRAELAAVDAARVSVALEGVDGTSGEVRAVVTNDGPDGLIVQSLRLEAAGYRTLTVDEPAAVHAVVLVAIPDTRTCSPSLVNQTLGGFATVRLRVAGRTVTRSVVAAQALWQAVTEQAQDRCGYLPGLRAVGMSVGTRPVSKGVLEVTLALTNKGRLPLLVSYPYSTTPGLDVRGAPPPGVVVPSGRTSALYRFRLTVTDCTQLRAALLGNQAQIQLAAQVQLRNGPTTADSLELLQRLPELTAAIAQLADQRCGPA